MAKTTFSILKRKNHSIQRLAVFLTFSSLLTAPAVVAEVSPEVHEKCLKASDYSGCVEVQINGVAAPTESAEKCDKDGSCIAKRGEDRLGLPKIAGWKYETRPDGQVYYYEIYGPEDLVEGSFRSKWYLIPHKGQKRYIGRRVIVHYYDEGKAAVAGQTVSSGGGTTTCNSLGSSVNCYSTPGIKTYIPGSPGRSAGPRSISYVQVLDCRDKTGASYIDGVRLSGNWISLGSDWSSLWACTGIESLPVLEMKL
jgi:hypothetical protein